MSDANLPTGAGRRILIVEDEYMIADNISVMLEDMGYEVMGPVATIPEALIAIARDKLDGALLDANLGGKSSAPIAAELAARQVPFIVVTGYGDLELATPALHTAPRVHKPFTSSTLAAILAKTMASVQ